MPNGLVFECHSNTRQPSHLNTGQILFSYVLVWYLNGWSSTLNKAHKPTIWILNHLKSKLQKVQYSNVSIFKWSVFRSPLHCGVKIISFRNVLTLSRTSPLLVEANMITPSLDAIPSISTRSWLRVCSASPVPPPALEPPLRFRPKIKIIGHQKLKYHGTGVNMIVVYLDQGTHA